MAGNDPVRLAAMTTKAINDLPDLAFAYIEPGGKKDSEGKTTPRSLRHFPVHDSAHVRNALARMSQSPFGEKAKAKINAAAKKFGIKVSATEVCEGFPFSEDADDPTHFGYIIDLSTIKFDESYGEPTWIQAFPVGKWSHPEFGTIEMTLEKAARMAANVNNGVRGQDLDIDYDHKSKRDDAAGWVQRAEVRPDGLWVLVEWTREARQKIKEKAYKYFSPEFSNLWKHTASGQIFKDVLWGGALTNRPHLKGIQAINLSEYLSDDEIVDNGTQTQKSNTRELLELLASLYSINFDEKTDEEILVRQLSERVRTTPPVVAEPDSEPTIAIYMQEDWSSFDLPAVVDDTGSKEYT